MPSEKSKKKAPKSACQDLAELLGVPDDEYEDFKELFKAAIDEMHEEEEAY